MQRFRVNDLTVALDRANAERQACGVNFSCPGGPAGSFCALTNNCPAFTIDCRNITVVGCRFGTIDCNFFTNDCIVTRDCGFATGGCGLNFSTLQPTDITRLIQTTDPVERVELISTLKADLGSAIEQLEIAEKQSEALAQPQTFEQAEQLERRLESALDEVKQMKKKLGK